MVLRCPHRCEGIWVSTVQLARLQDQSYRPTVLARADGAGWQIKEVCLHRKERPEPAPTELLER